MEALPRLGLYGNWPQLQVKLFSVLARPYFRFLTMKRPCFASEMRKCGQFMPSITRGHCIFRRFSAGFSSETIGCLMSMGKERYNYFVEDGQFSFEVCLDRLLGAEGQVVALGVDGEDEYSQTYILAITGTDVYCIGTIENSIPQTQEAIDSWKAYFSIGDDYTEFEVTYLAAGEEWSSKKEMKEVIEAGSETDVRAQFRNMYPDCWIHRIVAL
jgi:hypothetical protein